MSEKKYSRSISQYKSVSRCGEAFFLERLMRKYLPERPAPWSFLGIAVHAAFVDWENADRDIDVCEIFAEYYDSYIEQARIDQPDLSLWMIPPGSKDVEKSIKTYRTRGLEKDVPIYRDRCLEAEWEVYRFEDGTKALELPFEIDLDGVVVKGYIDRVQWWPERGYATVEDLKTGNLDKWDRRQLGTYSFALKEQYEINTPYSRFWFSKSDQPSDWYDMSRYTREYLTNEYRIVDRIISEKLFLPNPGDHCTLCSVKSYCRELGSKPLPEKYPPTG